MSWNTRHETSWAQKHLQTRKQPIVCGTSSTVTQMLRNGTFHSLLWHHAFPYLSQTHKVDSSVTMTQKWQIISDSSQLPRSLTSLRLMASCSSFTTSSPSTPSQSKPFVQRMRRPTASPSCLQGNEKVKPRGIFCPITLCSDMKLAMQSAMWSNSCEQRQGYNSLNTACSMRITGLQ